MQSSVDILNAVAKKLGGVTDYRIAKETGIPAATVCSVRAGRCSLSRENCAKAAEVLGVEVGALIAIVTAEREENPDIRKSLLRVARRGMAAATLAAAVGLSAAPSPPAQASSAPQQSGPMFIMSTRRRRPAQTGKAPLSTGTYPTATDGKRPTLHLRPTTSPLIPTTTT